MREFTSYGSPNPKLHYYAPREELVEKAYRRIVGNDPDEGCHYITVWAPRQTGKTWVMLEVMKRIRKEGDFQTAVITMQSAKEVNTDEVLLERNTGGKWAFPRFGRPSSWSISMIKTGRSMKGSMLTRPPESGLSRFLWRLGSRCSIEADIAKIDTGGVDGWKM